MLSQTIIILCTKIPNFLGHFKQKRNTVHKKNHPTPFSNFINILAKLINSY